MPFNLIFTNGNAFVKDLKMGSYPRKSDVISYKENEVEERNVAHLKQ